MCTNVLKGNLVAAAKILNTQNLWHPILLSGIYLTDIYVFYSVQFSSVQSLSHVQLFATPWIAARQASLSITNSQSLLKLMSIE